MHLHWQLCGWWRRLLYWSHMNSLDVCSLPIFDKTIMIHVPSIKKHLTRLLCPSNIRCEWILSLSIVQYVDGTFYGRVQTCCLLCTSNKSHWDIFRYLVQILVPFKLLCSQKNLVLQSTVGYWWKLSSHILGRFILWWLLLRTSDFHFSN